MRFIPIISLSILILLLTACSADTGSSVNASANLSQDQPHQDIPALPLTDSGLSLLVKDYTYTPKPQADPSTTANKIVSFYGVTDRHNDSFLCDNIQFFAYRKTCTPSCYGTT